MEDKSFVSLSEIVYGFQKIRTGKKDLVISDLETPNFPMHVENMPKVKTRTEAKLKLVNDKLEKLLSCEENTQNEAIANPLQRYIYGSKVGLPQTTTEKNGRTSLSELFRKTKIAEEKIDPIKNQTEKRTVNSVKTTLKKRSTTASVGTIDPASADEKLHKILRMQADYPEASAIFKKCQNLWKSNSNLADEDIITFPYRAISEVSQPIYSGQDTNRNKECWIKSDAEYVILEF